MGDMVLFFTLMLQVVGPLTWLGGMYRYTLRCLTDAGERVAMRDVPLLRTVVTRCATARSVTGSVLV